MMDLQSRVERFAVKFTNYLHTLTIKKIVVLGGLVVALSFSFLSLLFVLTLVGAFGSIPGKDDLLKIKNPIASEIYSADSVLLGRYFLQERSNISYSDIPQHVVDAVIATEDARFYEHDGLDVKSWGRVLIKSILFQQESAGGGSTLAQQVAKNLYPRRKYWFFSLIINKFREMIIASRLEDTYNKEEVLTLYLNTVPFGDNTFGLEAASQRFLSVPTRELSIDQGALLVGMLKATNYYNPRIHPQQAIERRNVIIGQLEKYDKISSSRADSLREIPLQLKYNKITHHSGAAPYFREHLRLEMLKWVDEYNADHEDQLNLYSDGLKIYTTLDSRLQHHAEEAMEHQMTAIQEIFLRHWGKEEPWKAYPEMIDEVVRNSDRYKNLERNGFSDSEIRAEMSRAVPMNIFNWEGEEEKMMSSIDSIKHYLKFLNTGMLALDPESGAVRVWVGGINHHYFQYDHVRESTKRQVGSTFKPIVYAAALENRAKPCNFITAKKTTYTNVEDWTPKNTEENYELRYSMPGALAYSVNTVSVRVLEKAGIDSTITLARKMGIESPLEPVPSLALGTAELSLIELAGAYACFVNKGQYAKPFFITSITSQTNELLEAFKPSPKQKAISEETAEMMLYMLQQAVEKGTGSSLRTRFALTNDIAGKTGTTQFNTDGWFMAVTPKLVVGAWVGADDSRIRFRSTVLGQGARTALPIVGEFMQRINRDKELSFISHARFPEIDPSVLSKVDCDFYKKDNNIFRKIFERPDKNTKTRFGEKKKKGFLKRNRKD
jgi:penicillin-binding protein 1A